MVADVERVGLRLDFSQARGPGFETHPASFRMLGKFTTRCLKSLGIVLVCPKKDRSCNVKVFPRWLLVNNSNSATICAAAEKNNDFIYLFCLLVGT